MAFVPAIRRWLVLASLQGTGERRPDGDGVPARHWPPRGPSSVRHGSRVWLAVVQGGGGETRTNGSWSSATAFVMLRPATLAREAQTPVSSHVAFIIFMGAYYSSATTPEAGAGEHEYLGRPKTA